MYKKRVDMAVKGVDMSRTIRLWTCNQCGYEGEWKSRDFASWGSTLTDEFNHRLVTCSDECRSDMGDPEKAFKKKYGRSASSSFYSRLS